MDPSSIIPPFDPFFFRDPPDDLMPHPALRPPLL
jgi:hypothetical protein